MSTYGAVHQCHLISENFHGGFAIQQFSLLNKRSGSWFLPKIMALLTLSRRHDVPNVNSQLSTRADRTFRPSSPQCQIRKDRSEWVLHYYAGRRERVNEQASHNNQEQHVILTYMRSFNFLFKVLYLFL